MSIEHKTQTEEKEFTWLIGGIEVSTKGGVLKLAGKVVGEIPEGVNHILIMRLCEALYLEMIDTAAEKGRQRIMSRLKEFLIEGDKS